MDTSLFYGFLTLLMLVASMLIYFTSKQQALLPHPIAKAPWRYAAYVLLIGDLAGWHLLLSPVAAFFWWLFLLGMMLSMVPFISLLRKEPLR